MSPIYRSPWLYHRVMRLLHGRHFAQRYEMLAAAVPEGSHVVEVCAGDAYLYRHFLKQRQVTYIGLDSSPAFVKSAQAQGLDFRLFDALHDPIPAADVVILQASLYHFPDTAITLIQRMLDAARVKVIISEPVRNLAQSKHPLIARLARWSTRAPGGRAAPHRYNAESFRALVEQFPQCREVFMEPGDREMVAIFEKQSTAPPTAQS